ncbi:MAG: hypothetical protein HYW07_18000 [Candidatus Latescibacteria bacterium]|nr:hypothetical protein [Candidatus Latescibacterota bacterium]
MSRYDGQSWQRFTTQDGLVDNFVYSVFQTRDGAMWFGTFGGVSVFWRPTYPLVQTQILRSPPALLGDSRFFFECRAYEIASDRQSPVSFAVPRTENETEDSDWSSFSLVTGFEVTGLDNGTWTLHVRAKDRYGNIDLTPATATFTVDLTPPTVVISGPRGVVHGKVEVTGSAFDNSAKPDLKSVRLEYGKGTSEDQVSAWSQERIQNLSTEPVVNGVLGMWDTERLSGPYVLRLTAEDSLNHRSQYAVTVNVVTAAEELDPGLGGHVGDSRAQVDLYVPPRGVERSTQVTITAVDAEGIRLPADGQQQFMGLAFQLQPDTLKLARPATLRLFLGEGVREDSTAPLALFLWSEADATWMRTGGTFDEESRSVSAAIDRLGTYALFAAPAEEGNGTELKALACQPRLISPRGGGFAQEMEISFALGRSALVSVRVFDMAGHLVRELTEGEPLFPGSNVVRWDGRDQEGHLVYDGAYVVAVEAGDKLAKEVVAVVNGQQ